MMANWLVGGGLALVVGGIVWKMIRDHKRGKGGCVCGGDCAHCHGACAYRPK